ncbi:MAG: TetR/AcrR family transcriptional regulator [Advenella sp.]|uniref:TetR/AcrR family transcriptional regulator n=1 Tax=unclassified Advenella TaxID=2685285 RepID=UPI00145C4B5A|nr:MULTISPECIES: TetR/AcrR family transcriptional regulator [unclassified Advenella]MDD3758989.1 TetR/AcrR family transcriptional regulator [Advenella sp.]
MSTAQHILESSLKLFYRYGFHASGVDFLSQEAGVTKKTLYRHYSSKDALIEAALELRHTQFMLKMRAFIMAAMVEKRPLSYIDFIVSWVQEEGFYGCAFINATAEFSDPDTSPHQQAIKHKKEVQSFLHNICSAVDGVLHPEHIAEQLFMIGEGIIVTCQVQGYEAKKIGTAQELARLAWVSATRS